MKTVTLFSIVFSAMFLLILSWLSGAVLGQVQYYEINAILSEEGKSGVELILTFAKPDPSFQLSIIGQVENFQASSTAGPINCSVLVKGTSLIDCKLNLTEEKRGVTMSFETNDFVRTLQDKFFFSGDFVLNKDVKQLYASVKLPPNSIFAGENLTSSKISYPQNASVFITEEGKMILIWSLSDLKENDPVRLEVLYQQVQPPPWFKLRARNFILFGVVVAMGSGFFVFRYFRKSEKLVLSVLDEHERKVISIISEAGTIKQKKIVETTKLSKAKVSRVVKSLAERGLIEVERRGRTNIINLVKKKFSL